MQSRIDNEVAVRAKRLTRQMQQDELFVRLRRELDDAALADVTGTGGLRWIVNAYDDAVKRRVRMGERVRSVLQHPDREGGALAEAEVADIMAAARSGRVIAPVPLLGTLYEEARVHEQRVAALVELTVAKHPAWPWMAGISGIGAVLAARLLSRLDITKAPRPSSFWAFCGLATVPGAGYRCPHCGQAIAGPSGLSVTPVHRLPDGTTCIGARGAIAEATAARVAQPRPRAGESRQYDATARTACYLIGVSFARRGMAYKALYQQRRRRLELQHPEWPLKRIVLGAHRFAVKRFLADLWVEWRRRVNLPVTAPYVFRARSA